MERSELQLKIGQVGEAVDQAQKELEQVSGRNKAFILYASELQNRLDKSKQKRQGQTRGGVGVRVREQLQSSRRLLSMKRG